ncbi:MAG: hypothetical protein CMH66_02015 [Nioella sp.]|nr:hypothetical protein [Nioella sp.]
MRHAARAKHPVAALDHVVRGADAGREVADFLDCHDGQEPGALIGVAEDLVGVFADPALRLRPRPGRLAGGEGQFVRRLKLALVAEPVGGELLPHPVAVDVKLQRLGVDPQIAQGPLAAAGLAHRLHARLRHTDDGNARSAHVAAMVMRGQEPVVISLRQRIGPQDGPAVIGLDRQGRAQDRKALLIDLTRHLRRAEPGLVLLVGAQFHIGVGRRRGKRQ